MSVLRGTLCGDGNLRINVRRRERNARLQLSQATRQREWLEWKVTELLPIFSENQPINDRRADKGELHISSRSFVELTALHTQLYGTGRKTFTREFLDQLDDLALAVWFCDDGSVDNHRTSSAPKMNVTDLRDGQVELIEEWFLDQGLKPHVCEERADHCREFYFGGSTAETFFRKVSPFVPKCMDYKLGTYRFLKEEVPYSPPNTW